MNYFDVYISTLTPIIQIKPLKFTIQKIYHHHHTKYISNYTSFNNIHFNTFIYSQVFNVNMTFMFMAYIAYGNKKGLKEGIRRKKKLLAGIPLKSLAKRTS